MQPARRLVQPDGDTVWTISTWRKIRGANVRWLLIGEVPVRERRCVVTLASFQTLLVCLHVHARFNVRHVFSVTFSLKLKTDKEEDLQRPDVTTQNALEYGFPQETGLCPILQKLRRSDLNCCVFIFTLFLQVLQLHVHVIIFITINTERLSHPPNTLPYVGLSYRPY